MSIAFAPQALNTDYGTQLASANVGLAGTPGTLQAGQALAARDAFAGLNANDPSSVNSALSSLVRAGATDQAKALQELQFERFNQQGAMTSATDANNIAQGGGPSVAGSTPGPSSATAPPPLPPLSPIQQAHQNAVIGFADDSVKSLLKTEDPTERANIAASVRQQAGLMGVDPSITNAALGDLSDQHLQSMDEHFQQVLQHPEFGGSGEAGPIPVHPATQAAGSTIASPEFAAAVARMGLYGVNTAGPQAAINQAQGYQGPVAPGQSVVKNGAITVGQAENPLPGAVEENPVGSNPLTVKHNADGSISVQPIPAGGSGTAPTPAAAPAVAPAPAAGKGGVPIPGYKPTTLAPQVTAALKANPGPFLSAALGFPVTITSTSRDAAHNAAVGGSPTSEHIPGNGYAVDFTVPSGVPDSQVQAAFAKSGMAVDQLIKEGNGSWHVGESNGGGRGLFLDRSGASAPAPAIPTTPQSQAPNDGMMHGRGTSAPYHPDWAPPGAMYTRDAIGNVSPVAGTLVDPQSVAALAAGAQTNPQVQAYRTASTAYNTAKANASTMSGPAALALLSATTGVTGTPEEVVKAAGLPNTIAGTLKGLAGYGPFTAQLRQQIMDVAHNAVTATYGQAAQFDASRAAIEKQSRLAPGSIQAGVGAPPPRYFVSPDTLPPPASRIVGQVYDGPSGPHLWSAKGWLPVGNQ
jgi:hypothetical protein